MTITNVSTYGSLQTLLQNMGQVQGELNTDQVEISSGKVSQTYDGLGSNVEQFVALGAQVTRLQTYQTSNASTVSQLNSTNTVLGQIQTIATNLKSLIASQVSGTTGSTASFTQQVQSALSSLTSELNTTYGGNYIFGGTNTDTPPVITPVPASSTLGVANNSYYQGSTQNTTIRIADGQEITNGVRADNPAFQDIFAGIAQALQSGDSSGDLQSAETLVSNGIQGVIALQATVNANIVTVQQVDTQSQALQSYYSGLTQSISQADVVTLSTQVAQDQSILEAAFETFSRISQLTLANYLK